MKTKEIKPIKRHNALVQLSREHHFGLLLVWKIRQGIKNKIDPQRISKYVLYFFEHELREHFREEENIFFRKLPQDDLLALRAFKEHNSIYALINQIQDAPNNCDMLLKFASSLENHIRFEERVLFNHLQETFSAEELKVIGNQSRRKTSDADDSWKDKFWEEKEGKQLSGGMGKAVTGIAFILFFSIFYACDTGGSEKNTITEEHDTAHVHGETGAAPLSLNQGKKWKADSITSVNVAALEEIILSAKPVTLDDFHAAGNKVHEAINKLIQDCRMQGADHEALHHWLEPILETDQKLMESKTADEANDAFLKMKEQIKIYRDYFE